MINDQNKLVLLLICLILTTACTSDVGEKLGNYRISLSPNNIYVVYTSTDNLEIAVIEGSITKWGTYKDYLYGFQESYCYSDEICTEQGYFFVNVRTGILKTGLSLEDLSHRVLGGENFMLEFKQLPSGKRLK